MYWNREWFMDYYYGMGLTLTWDVLKFYKSDRCTEIEYRLTLTWDVLKW
mgnify:CR=1 FL=1